MRSYIYYKLTQRCVLLQDSNPGISTLDPRNENVLLFSAIPKNQVTHLLQTPCLQNFSKATELSVQTQSQPHALAALEYPFGKPQPAILTLQS